MYSVDGPHSSDLELMWSVRYLGREKMLGNVRMLVFSSEADDQNVLSKDDISQKRVEVQEGEHGEGRHV